VPSGPTCAAHAFRTAKGRLQKARHRLAHRNNSPTQETRTQDTKGAPIIATMPASCRLSRGPSVREADRWAASFRPPPFTGGLPQATLGHKGAPPACHSVGKHV
jgi:hypothetical protein